MKVRSTMYYGDTPIADCTWELDDRARTTHQALAALSVEDHLKAELRVEHKIINEEDESKKNDEEENESVSESEVTDDSVEANSPTSEAGQTCDCTIQDSEDRELDRVEDQREIDEAEA